MTWYVNFAKNVIKEKNLYNGDIGSIDVSLLSYIFQFLLQFLLHFHCVEIFLYIIATIDPFTSDGCNESNFFIERQSCNYAYVSLREHRLSNVIYRKKKAAQSTHVVTIYSTERTVSYINQRSDLRQHPEKNNRAINCSRTLLPKVELLQVNVNTYIAYLLECVIL